MQLVDAVVDEPVNSMKLYALEFQHFVHVVWMVKQLRGEDHFLVEHHVVSQ